MTAILLKWVEGRWLVQWLLVSSFSISRFHSRVTFPLGKGSNEDSDGKQAILFPPRYSPPSLIMRLAAGVVQGKNWANLRGDRRGVPGVTPSGLLVTF